MIGPLTDILKPWGRMAEKGVANFFPQLRLTRWKHYVEFFKIFTITKKTLNFTSDFFCFLSAVFIKKIKSKILTASCLWWTAKHCTISVHKDVCEKIEKRQSLWYREFVLGNMKHRSEGKTLYSLSAYSQLLRILCHPYNTTTSNRHNMLRCGWSSFLLGVLRTNI